MTTEPKVSTAAAQFGTTWWAQRWISLLESFGWANRLQRGRTYARNGQVKDIEIAPGSVKARVKGSAPQPYKTQITLPVLPEGDWARVIAYLAEQAIYSATLLAGEMPRDIEEVFTSAHAFLFPRNAQELVMQCNCPDAVNPCKHIAAVFYLIGEEFDRDPFLMFKLRGRDRDTMLTALRARRAHLAARFDRAAPVATPPERPAAPPPTQINAGPLKPEPVNFWSVGESIDDMEIAVHVPVVENALLKRLGTPPFGADREKTFGTLNLAYRVISRRALDAAFGTPAPDATPDLTRGRRRGGRGK